MPTVVAQRELKNLRRKIDDTIELADETIKEWAEDNDFGPESKPYEKRYYGAIGDIEEFNCVHKSMIKKVLKKAGGRFASIRAADNVLWQPKSNVLSEAFISRFPKFAPSGAP